MQDRVCGDSALVWCSFFSWCFCGLCAPISRIRPACVCSLPFHKQKKWDTAQKRFKKPKKLKAEASSQHSAESQSNHQRQKFTVHFAHTPTPVAAKLRVDVSCGSRSSVMRHTHRGGTHSRGPRGIRRRTGVVRLLRNSLCRPRAHAAPSSCCTNTLTRGLQEEAIRND